VVLTFTSNAALAYYRAQSNGDSSSRPANNQAPSWPWASLNCMVTFYGSFEKNDVESILIEVLECGTILVSAYNLYEAVSEGFIKVKGLPWLVTLKMECGGPSICDSETGADLAQMIHCCLDLRPAEDTHGTDFYCMPVQFVKQDFVPAPSLAGLTR